MVLHALNFLIVLVAFAGNEDHVSLLSHHTGRANGLTTVHDTDHFLHLTDIKSCQHIVDDVLRLLKAGVVRSDDHPVALLHGLLGHQRTFTLITVAACSTNGNDLTLAVEHLMDGVEHILQSVRGMGIVHDSRIALLRADWIESSIHTLQRTQNDQYILRLLTEHDGSTIHGEQVAHIKLPDELYTNLLAIDIEIHSLEMTLYDLGLEVSHRTGGISLHLCLRVLHHEQTVLVVGIGDGEGVLFQPVEEGLFGITVILEGLMIVQMVTGEIRKETTLETESADTLLCDGMARALHEGILASGVHHPGQQTVQLYGVRRGMVCGNGLVLDIVTHRGEQSALMAELPEHII